MISLCYWSGQLTLFVPVYIVQSYRANGGADGTEKVVQGLDMDAESAEMKEKNMEN